MILTDKPKPKAAPEDTKPRRGQIVRLPPDLERYAWSLVGAEYQYDEIQARKKAQCATECASYAPPPDDGALNSPPPGLRSKIGRSGKPD